MVMNVPPHHSNKRFDSIQKTLTCGSSNLATPIPYITTTHASSFSSSSSSSSSMFLLLILYIASFMPSPYLLHICLTSPHLC
ncbi:hypothetical protein E2C01_099997 [Portunus trituberculatus]|uniref:Uncharacterized protein n=1 Tax=Portunus trituberculatus TaxID=210409 RepID=A0A5B7KCD1_PORTR|nr:hypothetical protein [Portunus trituberculatus]